MYDILFYFIEKISCISAKGILFIKKKNNGHRIDTNYRL